MCASLGEYIKHQHDLQGYFTDFSVTIIVQRTASKLFVLVTLYFKVALNITTHIYYSTL